MRTEPLSIPREALGETALTILLHFPHSCTYLNAQGRYVFANEAWLAHWGLRIEDVLGRPPNEVLGTMHTDVFAHSIARAFAGETVSQHRFTRNAAGEQYWVDNRFVPDVDATGRVKGVYIYSLSVDALKSTESMYATLERLTARMPDAWAYLDTDLIFRFANDAYLTFMGFTREQTIDHRYDTVLDATTVAASAEPIRRALAGETVRYERLRMHHGRGEQRWVYAIVAPDEDEAGHVRGIYAIVRDVHDEKKTTAALEKANWRVSAHLDHSGLAAIEWDADFNLMRWSERAHAMFGWTEAEVRTARMIEWRFVHPDDILLVHNNLAPLIAGEVNASQQINRNLRADGSTIWCEWHNSALRDEAGKLVSILSFAQDVTERVSAEHRLHDMALHDPLTQLPNRLSIERALNASITRAKQVNRQVAVLFIDLDRFKNINDTLGHRVGDELLIALASRLRTAVNASDVVGRHGGDEFIVVLDDVTGASASLETAKRLLAVLKPVFPIGEHALHVSASIGIAHFPDHGGDAETLFRHADVAMYRAKADGRNRVHHFHTQIGKLQGQMVAIESALRQAIVKGHVEVRYQPKVDFKTGHIIGAEALARWVDPILGEVGPERFVSVAEDTGLIYQLGEYVLDHACTVAAYLDRHGLAVPIGVNISVLQLQDVRFVERLRAALARTGCNPVAIELELTESAALTGADMVRTVTDIAKGVGVRIAIDDFGTGYSNLANLKRLPIETLKIDQTFVADLILSEDSRAIVNATIALAHNLNLRVVAEGVETRAQHEALRKMGCDAFQGYLHSQALKTSAFYSLLGLPTP